MPTDLATVEAWLPTWLPSQRWFADKSRVISGCRVLHIRPIDASIQIVLVRVAFVEGNWADYVVPLRTAPLSDGTDEPAFLRWLGDLMSGSEEWMGVVTRTLFTDIGVNLGTLPAKPMGVEQSNTSIRYGEDWVVKLNRRLGYGPSPEVELSSLLNRWPGPRCAPRTAAALAIRTDKGAASLAVQAEFVANEGDGWTFLLSALRAEAASGALGNRGGGSLDEVAAVARLTGDMHAALALDPWTDDLAPERISNTVAGEWERETAASLDVAIEQLETARASLSGRSLGLADVVSANVTAVRGQVAGFQALVGSRRMRVHGDYHLGQVLRTPHGAYVAIDFDGEPQRALTERRAKYSPLRDVAGMMRSLAYASGTVQAEIGGDVDSAALPTWERAARAVFLDTYLERLALHGADLLPRESEKIRQALAALEVEKAIYEVGYELNNRPDWVWIPLSQLVKMG